MSESKTTRTTRKDGRKKGRNGNSGFLMVSGVSSEYMKRTSAAGGGVADHVAITGVNYTCYLSTRSPAHCVLCSARGVSVCDPTSVPIVSTLFIHSFQAGYEFKIGNHNVELPNRFNDAFPIFKVRSAPPRRYPSPSVPSLASQR